MRMPDVSSNMSALWKRLGLTVERKLHFWRNSRVDIKAIATNGPV
jgi:hypothetical protein